MSDIGYLEEVETLHKNGIYTDEIKSVIESLGDCIKNQPCECEEFKLAIRSLQAWDEVLQELEETRKNVTELNIEYYLGELAGLKTAIDIINQHLHLIERGDNNS